MSANDLAAVIVAACSVVAVVLLAVALVALVRTLASAARGHAGARDRDRPRSSTTSATRSRPRTTRSSGSTGWSTTAESVTGTVDSASRLAYIAMSNPVIKGVAFASGTAKAARRLRGRKDGVSVRC